MDDAKKAVGLLDESQLSFIQEEFGHDPDALSALSDEDFEKLYDRLGDIEVEETMAAGDGPWKDGREHCHRHWERDLPTR